MTLLEVVIATVILAASLAVLAQLLNGARLASARAIAEVEAVQRAESAMAQAVAALGNLTEVESTTVEDGPWQVSTQAAAVGDGPLRRVTVVASGAGGVRVELVRLAFLLEAVE